MNKLIKDGKVAVIHSCDYGGGWSTGAWGAADGEPERMMFDPRLAALIIVNTPQSELESYIREEYIGDLERWLIPELAVTWVDQGEEFVITEYDGLESVDLKKEFKWTTA